MLPSNVNVTIKEHRHQSSILNGILYNGILYRKEYEFRDELNCSDIKICESFGDNQTLISRIWYRNGLRHRLDGPAYENFYADGTPHSHIWYQDDKFHRIDGPAIKYYNESGKCTAVEYWFNGKKVSKKEHKRQAAILQLVSQSQSAVEMSI
jgi:hypothetical protein